MIRYDIYHNEVLIGLLEINEEGKHHFIPNDYVKAHRDELFDITLSVDQGWRDPIILFQTMIDDFKKFDMDDSFLYRFTHNYAMKKRDE